MDYLETFSPVARLNSIQILLSLTINMEWAMFPLDVKNVFMYGDLQKEVYMEQPPGYVAVVRYWFLCCIPSPSYLF
jgi:hypothetical protein